MNTAKRSGSFAFKIKPVYRPSSDALSFMRLQGGSSHISIYQDVRVTLAPPINIKSFMLHHVGDLNSKYFICIYLHFDITRVIP